MAKAGPARSVEIGPLERAQEALRHADAALTKRLYINSCGRYLDQLTRQTSERSPFPAACIAGYGGEVVQAWQRSPGVMRNLPRRERLRRWAKLETSGFHGVFESPVTVSTLWTGSGLLTLAVIVQSVRLS